MFHVKHSFISNGKGRVFMDFEFVDVRYYESASPFGDWHVTITVDGCEPVHYTSYSFLSVQEYAVRYLVRKAMKKECL